jgi:hypothetical protein
MSMGDDLILLQQIRIASPCHASWDEMQGDERVRFCEQSRLNVYNLSSMSAAEAAALVRKKEGRLCTRYYARADGTMLVDNCPAGFRAARRLLLAQLGTIAGAFTLLFGSVPFLNAERREAIRYSKVGQMEPFCTVLDWLGFTPLVAQGRVAVMVGQMALPVPPRSMGAVKLTAGASPSEKHHRRRRHRRNRRHRNHSHSGKRM